MKKLLIIILFANLLACSSKSEQTENVSVMATGAVSALAPSDVKEEEKNIERESDGIKKNVVTEQNQKIIKTADVRFRVESLKKNNQSIVDAVKKANGLITTSNQSNQNGFLEMNSTIRVPSQSFDVLLETLSQGSIYTDYKNIRSEDVTAEFIDTEARTKAKKAVELRYIELLKQAKNVEEIIAVESKLAEIREEIEAKEGRLKYLNDQVSYSTINLNIYEQTSFSENPEQPFYKRIWLNITSGFVALEELIVGFFVLVPFLLVGGTIFYFIKKWWKKRKALEAV